MSLAATKIDKEAFNDVMSLISEKDWLRKKSSALLDLWNLCDQRDEQELLKELFDRFLYVPLSSIDDINNEFVKKITSHWNLVHSRTIISGVSDKDQPDGSMLGLQLLKGNFDSDDGWKEKNFITSITEASHKVRSNDDLILFDDFIGSGKTLINKIKYINKINKERGVKLKSLRVISYASMKEAKDNIFDNSEKVTDIYSFYEVKKGISDYCEKEVAELKMKSMMNLEGKLSQKFRRLKVSDHSLGYKKSEALYCLENSNCPNNVFPIFWWPKLLTDEKRETVLKRIR